MTKKIRLCIRKRNKKMMKISKPNKSISLPIGSDIGKFVYFQ